MKNHARFRQGLSCEVEAEGWRRAMKRWHIPREAKTNPNYPRSKR
jgi:hypothetical protein